MPVCSGLEKGRNARWKQRKEVGIGERFEPANLMSLSDMSKMDRAGEWGRAIREIERPSIDTEEPFHLGKKKQGWGWGEA